MQYTAVPVRRHGGFGLVVALLLAVLAFASPAAVAAQVEIPSTPAKGVAALTPYMEWMLDASGKLGVEEAASPGLSAEYRPLQVRALPHAHGVFWIRMVMAARPANARPAPQLLDIGNDVPGTPVLYVPEAPPADGAWKRLAPGSGNVFILPEADAQPTTLYLRLDGPPGLWFAPTLRTPHNAATAMERLAHPALLVALAVVMLLCLVRGLSERGEWRLWTSAFVGAVLISATLGIPVVGAFSVKQIAATVAPGVALMLLAHVGRHLTHARITSRALDVQYVVLSLPGAALALLPLIPGYAWTARYLDLWPAGTLLLVPTTVAAWLSGLPGARRLLLGCLLPPVGVCMAWMGLGATVPATLAGSAPMWGLALGALIIAGAGTPKEHSLSPSRQATVKTVSPQALVEDDPNLRIVPGDDLPTLDVLKPATPPPDTTRTDAQALALEEALRAPLDTLLRDGAAMEQCALPPAARQLCQSMLGTVRGMTAAISGAILPQSTPLRSSVFDLQEGLRQAHDAVSPAADAKNIALSWFMPPHLPHRYKGDGAQVTEVLRMLLESSVRATSRGAVQVAVSRVPESISPGHLLFNVTDTGTGMPPEERSSLALVRAWELAGAYRGFLGLESGPHGATVSFTMHLEVADDDRKLPPDTAPGIILVEDSSSSRQLLAFFLEGLPYRLAEARSPEEAAQLHERRPAKMLIFDADMPVDLAAATAHLREREAACQTPPAALLALIGDESTAERLREAGFEHTLPKPVTRAGLREAVTHILAPTQDEAADAPLAEDAAPQALASPTQSQAANLANDVAGGPATSPTSHVSTFDQPLLFAPEEAQPQALPIVPPVLAPAPTTEHSKKLVAVADAHPAHEDEAVIVDTGLPLVADDAAPVEDATPAKAHVAEHDLLPLMGAAPLSLEPVLPAQEPPQEKTNAAYLHSLVLGDDLPSLEAPQAAKPAMPQAETVFTPLRMGAGDEWVGEPMPVAKNASGAPVAPALEPQSTLTLPDIKVDITAQRPTTTSTAPPADAPRMQGNAPARPDTLEWVGDPMPIIKAPAPAAPVAAPEPPLDFATPSVAPAPVQAPAAPTAASVLQAPLDLAAPVAATTSAPAAPSMPTLLSAPMPAMVLTPEPSAPAPDPAEAAFVPLSMEPEDASNAKKRASLIPPSMELMNFIISDQPDAPAPKPALAAQPATAPAQPAQVQAARPAMPTLSTQRPQAAQPAAEPRRVYANIGDPMPIVRPQSTDGQMPLEALLEDFDQSALRARQGYENADTDTVRNAARHIAFQADSFGLRALARMARCVEDAAKAGDKDALANLLPELESFVERNRIAMRNR